jgi:redox-sensitive bicupin YhaK (pirin superfamily)
LTKGDSVYFKNEKSTQLHFVLIAGEPLNEPIVQHGPFVMNSEKEIHEAFEDFNYGKNGFEKAAGWKSQSGNKR